MADAAKIEVAVTYSENADYTSPQWVSKLDAVEVTPSAALAPSRVSITTTAHTLDVTPFSDGSLVIKNNDTDTTDYVYVEYTTLGGTALTEAGGTAPRCYGGKTIIIGCIDASAADVTITAQAGNGPCVCDIIYIPHS